MIIKFENFKLITENPDSVYDDEKNKKYTVESSDALPFFCKVNSTQDKVEYIYTGEESSYHEHMQGIDSKYRSYPGRIWTINKIIAFWVYPNVELFKSIIKEFEKKLNIKIFNNGWRIEVIKNKNEIVKTKVKDNINNINSEDYEDYYYFGEDVYDSTELVPIEEYVGSEDIPEEERKWHIMNWKEKEIARKKGYGPKWYGSDITSWDGPKNIKWRQQMYQEKFKNEL